MAIRIGIDIGSDTIKTVVLDENQNIRTLPILSAQGQPLRRVKEALQQIVAEGIESKALMGVTGAGARSFCDLIGIRPVDEPSALAASVDRLYPDVRTVVEMGRESQKYILFARDEVSGRLLVEDSSLGNKCAAGSGSFLDHMSRRLNFPSIEAFAKVALETENPASLSGRCGVFTESDIVHLYQKGTTRERIAAGIHAALCRNYRSAFAKGKVFRHRVAFIGGVALNPAMVKYLSRELGLDGELFVPEQCRTLGAIGAALRSSEEVDLHHVLEVLEERLLRPLEYIGTSPLRFRQSEVLSPPPKQDVPKEIALAALGIDIGSVSTKAALVTEIDGKLHVLASYYRRTDGDPLAAVRDTVSRIHQQVQEAGYRIGKIVAATTGSGRYLTADYVGADLVKNEITAQAHGAMASVDGVDAIFEIGGQDSKFIRLQGSVVVDFEMNKACAAGTGAFLEKQAARLGITIDEFGDYALRGTNPPDLDWTCTVFSESAMVYYQQNNVPIEDLCAAVCLASVKNYLNKNVGSRDIGKKIVFQGAVAFNKGMVAAFETILGRKIVVPPHPHITGAIGAARLAYRLNPEKSSFRGFEAIAEGRYRVASFECKVCPNHCDVNTFQMDGGPKYFYNDRCERYSGVNKKRLGAGLPDLFAEREAMLFSVYPKKARPGSPRIGIPRGLMFAEYFPLYNAFFTELGFEVVPSDETSKRIVRLGLEAAIGEPCFPFKVAHGHVLDVISKNVDYVFLPAVLNTEQPNSNLRKAQTCPYLQAAPEVIATTLNLDEKGIVRLSPRLQFQLGERHLRRAFIRMAQQLGASALEAVHAFRAGLEALREFRQWQERRGREVLDSLKPDDMAFVVVGRPYTLYDGAVNMDIGKKIQDLGILAIPQDFIPLDKEDISDSWPNAYSRQIQKKLAAARLIRQDPRLRAVVLTYFACGPDSFANQFFKDEVGKPCYMMQIDEHTADAGMITRIEAFADTARAAVVKEFDHIRTNDTPATALNGKRLWIPYASEAAHVLAAALRAYGIDAEVLPRSPDPGMNLARAAIPEDVCLPAFMTTEDILYRVNQPDFDPSKEAFFQGNSEGPCRFGMYYALQRRILDKMDLREVDIVTLGSRSHHGGLGTRFSMVAWDGLVAHDLLFKMLLRTRPYEINPGESEALYRRYLKLVCEMMPDHKRYLESFKGKIVSLTGGHLGKLQDLLHAAARDFSAIPRRSEHRPLVGVVGEFYVRLHEGANQDILRKIEQAGGETWLAPLTEFFSYANLIGHILALDRWRDTLDLTHLREAINRWVLDRLARQNEHRLYHASLPFLAGYDDIPADQVIKEGSRYVHPTFGGEAICSMGKAEDFACRGLDGIVSVIPFNCMPGNTVTALSQALRRRHGNIPFLNLDYDGFVDASRDAKIASFMWQVKERFESKRLKEIARS
ncbi:MAG: acyl-CoA dehydratase activase [Armatimonadota bacterium]